MKIALSAFEQQIDPVIVERGLEYWENGAVGILHHQSKNLYQAAVDGTKQYKVFLRVGSDKVSDWSCTCPYDFGPVCKHMVAVLYAVRESVGSGKIKEVAAVPVAAEVEESVDEIVDKMTERDLRTLVKTRAQKDGRLRTALTAKGGENPLTKSQCTIAIKRLLRGAMGRDRFIGLSDADWAAEAVGELLDKAEAFVSAGQLLPGFNMACAVLEEMIDALQFADDSNGDIGHCIGRAMELLEKLVRKEYLPQDVRIELYRYFVAAFSNGRFHGWDWHLGMLELAVPLVQDEREERELSGLLEKHNEEVFQKHRAQEIRMELVRRRHGQTEAERFRDLHLDNPEFRAQAIRQALTTKDFKKAEALALDGIGKDSTMAGLVHDWKDWLLKIAVAKGDRPAAVEQARKLFLNDWQFQNEYYRTMKQYTPSKQWSGFLEALIKSASAKSTDDRIYLLADIFVAEKLWERLLDLLSKKPDLACLDHYGQHLSSSYPKQLGPLYGQAVQNFLKKTYTLNRKQYQYACRFLRRMKKLGTEQEMIIVAEQIRKDHNNRPALLDELNRL